MFSRSAHFVKSGYFFYTIILGLYFLALSYDTLMLRHVHYDNAELLFKMLLTGEIPFDGYRYFSSVFYIPSAIYTYFFSETKFFSLNIYLYLNGFSLISQHFLSLYVCYKILHKTQKTQYFIFPFISFMAIGTMNLTWPSSQVHEVRNLFWPVLFCLLLIQPSMLLFITLLFFSTALSLTHEAAVYVNTILLFIALYKMHLSKNKRTELIFYFCIALLFFVAILSCVYRSLKFHPDGTSHFLLIFKDPELYFSMLSPFVLLHLLFMVVVLFFTFFPNLHSRFISMLIVFMTCTHFVDLKIYYIETSQIRILTSLLTPLLAFIFIFYHAYQPKKFVLPRALIGCFLIFNISKNLILTFSWNDHIALLNKKLNDSQTNCVVLNTNKNRYLSSSKLEDSIVNFDLLSSTTFKSILFQNDMTITKIAYLDSHKDACSKVTSNSMPIYNATYTHSYDLNFSDYPNSLWKFSLLSNP